ncbi:Ion channel [Popillia japonica]|uniref:Ion channel n=1 Tax=Popillia japonica TaxID=7064 RepID=A0AAW1IWJ9_POPJA
MVKGSDILSNGFYKSDKCLDDAPFIYQILNSDEDLENLISEVVRASNRGVSAAKNVSNPPNWSFGQSLFFSTTVVTTIGYGHVTPLSRSGKVFCIIYAMCGIPLTLHWLLKQLGNVYQPLHIKLLHLIAIVIVLLFFFLVMPAFIFASIEPDWDFLDSFYYCFISLTTIGLGDYIPGDNRNQQNRALYKILTSCYLVIGLTFMMLTLALFYDIPQLNIGQLFKAHEDVDSEKARLATYGLGLQYGIDSKPDQEENTHRQVVRVRSRQRDDSPSPEDPPIGDFMK